MIVEGGSKFWANHDPGTVMVDIISHSKGYQGEDDADINIIMGIL